MKKLVLKTGLSYSTKDLKCIKGSPFVIDDEKAEALLATGRFEEIPAATGDDVPFEMGGMSVDNVVTPAMNDADRGGAVLSADAVAGMKKAELAELAAAKGIDISDCKNKEDIVNRINGAMGLASMVQMGMES